MISIVFSFCDLSSVAATRRMHVIIIIIIIILFVKATVKIESELYDNIEQDRTNTTVF